MRFWYWFGFPIYYWFINQRMRRREIARTSVRRMTGEMKWVWLLFPINAQIVGRSRFLLVRMLRACFEVIIVWPRLSLRVFVQNKSFKNEVLFDKFD